MAIRLALPKGEKVKIVLDTDAKNEIDDQFAITFALLSEKMQYDWAEVGEYNLMGDFKASQVIFECGVPLIRVPCFNVTSKMILTKDELNEHIRPYGVIGSYLGEIFCAYPAVQERGKSCIWDLAAVALMENPDWAGRVLLKTPSLLDDATWGKGNEDRPLHRVVTMVNRDAMFNSLYDKLKKHVAS